MNNKITRKRIIKYVAKYKFMVLLSFLFSIITVLTTLYAPILTGNAIDLIIEPGRVAFDDIKEILIRFVCVIAVTMVAQLIVNLINNNITYKVVRDVRIDAFFNIEMLPLRYIDSHQQGDIVSRVISDIDQFADGLLMGISQLFSGVATILATLAFMVYLNVTIAVIVVVLTPISLVFATLVAKKTFKLFQKQSESRGELTSIVDEMVGQQKTVQAFGYEQEAVQKFDKVNSILEKNSMDATFYSSVVNPATRFINNMIYAAVGIVGSFFGIAGKLTVGELTCFLSYANQYTKPFNDISNVVTELQNAFACAGRVFEIIDEEPQTPDVDDAAEMKNVEGRIDIDNVWFSYVPDKKLITNLNLHVNPGMRVAIVGPTGCGKSTIINLLMRFYDVDQGTIKVDGVNVRDIRRVSLRKSYGMVLQETWLKSGTIRENIAYGRPDATDEEVIEAARKSHADSFIRRMKNGYNTFIGEDGGSLSQGQKQLLCITRVMLDLPPMLILDEATSSIDTRTENRIQKAFNKMMQGRTSFIVAHRLSTIKEADLILVMKDGNIIEQGTHQELVVKDGFYKELYNSGQSIN